MKHLLKDFGKAEHLMLTLEIKEKQLKKTQGLLQTLLIWLRREKKMDLMKILGIKTKQKKQILKN